MKKDLATAIGTALVGAVAAFFICNFIIGSMETPPATFKTLSSSVSVDLAEPSVEVFNYKALNPTVEVYVGDCQETNEYGECIDKNNGTQENK